MGDALAENRLLHELGVGVEDAVVAGEAGEHHDVGLVTVRPGDSHSSPRKSHRSTPVLGHGVEDITAPTPSSSATRGGERSKLARRRRGERHIPAVGARVEAFGGRAVLLGCSPDSRRFRSRPLATSTAPTDSFPFRKTIRSARARVGALSTHLIDPVAASAGTYCSYWRHSPSEVAFPSTSLIP